VVAGGQIGKQPAATIEHTLTGASTEPTWTPGLLTSPDASGQKVIAKEY